MASALSSINSVDIATIYDKFPRVKREKNLFFKELKLSTKNIFGGALLKNSHAKEQRPISTKRAMHLVLRSLMCKGELSLLTSKNARRVEEIIRTQGKKLGVKIYRLANSGNHLHLLVCPKSRHSFQSFLRAISGLIPRAVLDVERGRAKEIKFWDKRPFSRIVEWGKDFSRVKRYLQLNILEATGFVGLEISEVSGRGFG